MLKVIHHREGAKAQRTGGQESERMVKSLPAAAESCRHEHANTNRCSTGHTVKAGGTSNSISKQLKPQSMKN